MNHVTPATLELLRHVRDGRFSAGLRCPRCSATHVIRWGSFSGRQRYRCRACTRTFSDLTGTPLAYCKRTDAWLGYMQCLREALSVRQAGKRLGINKDTAFRWRHRYLTHLRQHERCELRGVVELLETRFPYSEKGQRHRSLPARMSSATRAFWSPHVRVLLACDRAGGQWSAIRGARYVSQRSEETGQLRRFGPLGARYDDILRPLLRDRPTLVGKRRRLGSMAAAATRLGCRYEKGHAIAPAWRDVLLDFLGPRSARSLYHLERVKAMERRLLAWMERFRGVATKYLENYLAWRRMLDPLDPACLTLRMLQWDAAMPP
jgi:transposase-like protein